MSWWWTGRPGVLWFMGLQRAGLDWATELNWLAVNSYFPPWAGSFLFFCPLPVGFYSQGNFACSFLVCILWQAGRKHVKAVWWEKCWLGMEAEPWCFGEGNAAYNGIGFSRDWLRIRSEGKTYLWWKSWYLGASVVCPQSYLLSWEQEWIMKGESDLRPEPLPRCCFYWNITALQYYISFFCAMKWISYIYIYIYPLPLRLPLAPHPCRSSQSSELNSLCCTAASH